MQRPMCTVGVDGSVYKYHPKVHGLMTECMSRFVDPKLKVSICAISNKLFIG